jgi:hypothetical protein
MSADVLVQLGVPSVLAQYIAAQFAALEARVVALEEAE